MLPCASLAERSDPSRVAMYLLFGQQLEESRGIRPMKMVCLPSEQFPMHASVTTEGVLACLQTYKRGAEDLATPLDQSVDRLVNREPATMTIDYDIVPSPDALRWHYTIACVLGTPHHPSTLCTREIDILREAMWREGEEFPADPPGDSLCRISGRVVVEMDVLSPSSDMMRYARRQSRSL
jgi:hypothetical protein